MEIVFIAHEVIDLQPRICSVIKSLPCMMRLKHISKMEEPKSEGSSTSPSSIKECNSDVLKQSSQDTVNTSANNLPANEDAKKS